MLREIKDCPLIATLRNGKLLSFSHDVTIKGLIVPELTLVSVATIAAELSLKGVDIMSVSIDEAKVKYEYVEVL